MGNNINWLYLAALIAAGIAVLFLVGGPRTETKVVTTPPVAATAAPQPTPAGTTVKPYVNAGPDITVHECSSVQLTCEGYDPNGKPVTYHWTAENNQGTFSDPNSLHPIYTAPPTCSCERDVTLTLTVTNSQGISASDDMVVHVRKGRCCPPVERCKPILPAPCCPHPVLPCGAKPSFSCCPQVFVPTCPASSVSLTPLIDRSLPASINEGQPIQLHGRISGPSCNISRIYWTADKGSFCDSTSLDPFYFAPTIDCCAGEDVTIDLNVVDVNGVRTFDQVRIHVNNVQ